MNEFKQISSLQNPLVKRVLQLKHKSRERKRSGLFVVEGRRELRMALKGGYEIETVLFCPDIVNDSLKNITEFEPTSEFIVVTKDVYEKLAYRESTQGIMAIAKVQSHTLEGLVLTDKNPLILVAEAPEKPGNIGALLRTADAADLDAVIIADANIDLYHPNTIRSSIGCLFTRPIAVASTVDSITYLQKKNISILCAALSASKRYVDVDFTTPSAIVVGSESKGLSDEWLENSDQNIIIPMHGEIDSMNVSVSAAILIFEAKRQRGLQ